MDEYTDDDMKEFLQILYAAEETPSLLGDAETTTTAHPSNINDRLEPVPSTIYQVQDQPRRLPQQPPLTSLTDTFSQALQDLDQNAASNRSTVQLQHGHFQYQELYTPAGEGEATYQGLQNITTVPWAFNFGYSESIGYSQEPSNWVAQPQSQLLSSSANQEAYTSSYHQQNVVAPPILQDPLMIARIQMREAAKQRYLWKKYRRRFAKPHKYASRSEAASKKKRLKGKFVKGEGDEEFDYDPADDPPAQQ